MSSPSCCSGRARCRRVIGAQHVVEDPLAVQRHHRLHAVLRHHVDGLAAGDRHVDLDRQVLRPRHHRDVLELCSRDIPPAAGIRRTCPCAELRLVEAFEQELQLLLEHLAVLLGVEQRRAEALDLAGVIAAADAHDDAAVGDDVGHRVVFGQPDRMPHRQDVEGAAELQPLGLGRQPQPQLDQVRDDLVALALEMVLGDPQHVVAELVHGLRDVLGGGEHLGQPLVGIAPVVGRRAVQPDIVQLDLADIEHVEFPDHALRPGGCRGRA